MDTATASHSSEKDRRSSQMEAIVAEHETALLRYAARILNNACAAQDVVQNVFIKLFQSWPPGMKPSKQLSAWLYRVTHNEAIDHIRRESRLRLLHEKQSAEDASGCSDGVNCPPSDDEKREMVLGLLRRLQPHEQQVVLLRLEEGLSYKDISEITGRSEGNVGNILHFAVKKLAEQVKRSDPGGAT